MTETKDSVKIRHLMEQAERLPKQDCIDFRWYFKDFPRLLDGNEVFNIGDRIISVNGETINEDNICYYYDLLKTQNDWSEFEIETR